jgi:hypothetical protein
MRTGRISKSRTRTPRRASCQAASLPASPAPITLTIGELTESAERRLACPRAPGQARTRSAEGRDEEAPQRKEIRRFLPRPPTPTLPQERPSIKEVPMSGLRSGHGGGSKERRARPPSESGARRSFLKSPTRSRALGPERRRREARRPAPARGTRIPYWDIASARPHAWSPSRPGRPSRIAGMDAPPPCPS